MDWRSVAWLGLISIVPLSAWARGGPDSPATPVPQYSPDEALGVSLWPLDESGEVRLRPAGVPAGTTRAQLSPLPESRDSTQYITQTAPGEFSGHELFQDVAVPNARDEGVGQSEWLFSVYNAGIQVWRLQDPEQPSLVQQLDGWPAPYGPGEWEAFAVFGEVDTYVNRLDVRQAGDSTYVGVSADVGVGFSAWAFEPSNNALTQTYQDLSANSKDVALVEAPGGNVYAFVANRGMPSGNGVRVYDLSAAADGEPCVDDGAHLCGVYRGTVGAIPPAAFVSALVVGEQIYVAAADGNAANGPLALEIWALDDPDDPAMTSSLRFSGLGTRIHAPQLFTYAGHHYVALVDKSEGLAEPGQMRIYEVGHCLDADGCDDLGAPVATEGLLYSAASYHYLDLSFSAGVPFLHNGMQTTGLFGSGFERLWNLSQLPQAFAPDTLPEATDGGGSYADPCSGEAVDYFGDYYVGNEYGLNRFNPRHAVFSGPYLYRAASTVLDAHVRSLDDCGDGVVQPGEACDDGNLDDTDGCTSTCESTACGDGQLDPGEACDDGNTVDDDGCTNACTLPACGDGVVQAGEECDDPDDPGCVDCMMVAGGSQGADDTSGGGMQSGGGDTTEGDGGDANDGGASDGCGCASAGAPSVPQVVGLLGLLGLLRVPRRRAGGRAAG